MNNSHNEYLLQDIRKQSKPRFIKMILIVTFLLSTSCLSVENPERVEEKVVHVESVSVESNLKNDGKTGFYAQLSPQVGGGHMVTYRSGEVKYLSVKPIIQARDIKISTISGYSVVSIFLDTNSREWLLEESKLRFPSVYAITFMEAGRIVWCRSLADILAENWVIVGILESKKEAEGLAEQIRLAQ